MGHFDDIRDSDRFTIIMNNVNHQVETALRDYVTSNNITQDTSIVDLGYNFNNSYDFTFDVFPIGSATVSGVVTAVTVDFDQNGDFIWESSIDLKFHDVFEDPLDLFDITDDTFDYADPFVISQEWSEDIRGEMFRNDQGGYDYDYGY